MKPRIVEDELATKKGTTGKGAAKKLRLKAETLKDLDATDGQKIRAGRGASRPVNAFINRTCFTCGCPIIKG